MIEEEIRSSK